MAASKALPPRARSSAPISAANGCGATTTPLTSTTYSLSPGKGRGKGGLHFRHVSVPHLVSIQVGQRPGLTQRVEATGRRGWYMRVRAEGAVAAGQPIVLLERPTPEWTLVRAF